MLIFSRRYIKTGIFIEGAGDEPNECEYDTACATSELGSLKDKPMITKEVVRHLKFLETNEKPLQRT